MTFGEWLYARWPSRSWLCGLPAGAGNRPSTIGHVNNAAVFMHRSELKGTEP